MVFNSIQYLLFFAVVCSAYFLLQHRWRWALLLGSSYFFYAVWNPKYLVLILASTLVDYVAGLALDRLEKPRARISVLIGSLTCNLGLLFTFKYFDFAVDVVRSMLGWTGIEIHPPELQFLLPVGISFYTFQSLSYSIEVYRRTHGPERHLGIFALYVAFFPQLVAGPIERSYRLLPQFLEDHGLDYDRMVSGFRLILWGLFKKVVVADNLALAVDLIYSVDADALGPAIALGTIFFAYQIYCDFSGYSDIAVGSARVLGFDLMTNFKRPYHADSIAEFWQRWHISLSTWFRDYLYIPLGGNRVSAGRWFINIAAVFVISGLWHGANLTFIIWGTLHGIYYLLEHALRKMGSGLAKPRTGTRKGRLFPTLCVFSLTCFAWIFFRAEDLTHAMNLIAGLTQGWGVLFSPEQIRHGLAEISLDPGHVLACIVYIVVLEVIEWAAVPGQAPRLLNFPAPAIHWPVYVALLLAIGNLGATREIPFIYFQF